MMERRKHLPLLLAVVTLVLSGRSDAEDGLSVLNSIRYSVRDTVSTVLLRFAAGQLRYIPQCQDAEVTIVFPQAVVASSPGQREIRFREGLVQSVRAQALPGDSLAVRLVLREHATASVSLTALGDCAVVRVEEARKQPPVNIAGVSGLPSIMPVTAMSVAPNAADGEPVESDIALALPGSWMLLLLVPGVSTILLLVFLTKQRRILMSAPPIPPVAVAATPVREELSPVSPAAEEQQGEANGHAVDMAKQFSRSQGELDLAFRLQGAVRTAGVRKELESLGARKIGKAGRVQAARKLGVGRGEMDLAFRLEEFKRTATGEEK